MDILKIDVEKAELSVLQSLGDRLCDVKAVVAEVHNLHMDAFTALLKTRYNHIVVGAKEFPKFCMGGKPVETWPEDINTFIVFAY